MQPKVNNKITYTMLPVCKTYIRVPPTLCIYPLPQALEGSTHLLTFRSARFTLYRTVHCLRTRGYFPFRGAPAEPTSSVIRESQPHFLLGSAWPPPLQPHWSALVNALNRPRSGLSQRIYTCNFFPGMLSILCLPCLTILLILRPQFKDFLFK